MEDRKEFSVGINGINHCRHRGSLAEMETSRPWPWPRGQLVMSLALGAKSLALASDVVCVLGLGKHVLGLYYYYLRNG